MNVSSHAFYAWSLSALALVFIGVCALTNHAIPLVLELIASASVGSAAGLSVATPAATVVRKRVD